jgi:hypothetical protein
MAEIVRRRPDLYSDYVPIVVALIQEMAEEDLVHFRAGILWAIGRLGPIGEKELDGVLPTIVDCLDHPDPQVRGMAVWCLEQCGRAARFADRDELLADDAPVDLYEDGHLAHTNVGRLVQRAVCDQSPES